MPHWVRERSIQPIVLFSKVAVADFGRVVKPGPCLQVPIFKALF